MTNNDLLNSPSNLELEIIEINAGSMAKKRLISMGVHVGDKLIKYASSSWGPILIRNVTLNSSKIAIGRRLASKIIVGYEET
jgi:Fe2+ transport system protein FeoA